MDDSASLATASPEAPKPKRSLFSRPTPAASHTTADAGDIFSRPNQALQGILAEQDRKRRLKLAKQQEATAKSHSPGSERREGKRRRISRDEEDGSDGGIYLSPSEPERLSKSKTPNPDRPSSKDSALDLKADSLSKRYEDSLAASKAPNQSSAVIDLLDSSDGEEEQPRRSLPERPSLQQHNSTSRDTPKNPHNSEPESEDEFPELAAAARERQRLRNLSSSKTSQPVPRSTTLTARSTSSSNPPPLPPPDPVIQLLVTSRLPDTAPLIVHRRLSQRLQEIRLEWCRRQNFDAATTASVFLIYRMRRTYDVTTCKSLGIGVDGTGNVVIKGDDNLNFADGGEGNKIHMEAVTEQIYREMRAEKEAERLKGTQHVDAAAEAEEEAREQEVREAAARAQEKASQIRLTLKGKGLKELKLIVKPDTTFAKMIASFRRTNDIPPDKAVFLEFDGDRLAPEDEVQSSEIGDLDVLDVHVR
ncbi:hypothetical protein LTR39_002148 [Cryomyces antarcticus]|nr:hypothetical protein LTR39_002148 [Cryomyces antarcticus]